MVIYYTFFQKIKYHMLSWGALIFYETLLIELLFGIHETFISYLLHYSLTIALFYLYSDFLLAWVDAKPSTKWIKLISLSACWMTIYLALHYGIEFLLNKLGLLIQSPPFDNLSIYFARSSYRALYFLGLANGYYYLKTYLAEKKKSAELEKRHLEDIIKQQQTEAELAQAENAFLKAQINPHFLFNTLDFVYHEVNASSPRAGATIISLSNMMRYALDAEQNGERISLMAELQQVEELVSIQRLRNEQLNLRLEYGPELEGLRIIPLVLLTLAENLFKHGRLNDAAEAAIFSLQLRDGFLEICTSNLPAALAGREGTQQGLENIRRRLELAYGSHARLDYGMEGNRFILRLSIAVAELR